MFLNLVTKNIISLGTVSGGWKRGFIQLTVYAPQILSPFQNSLALRQGLGSCGGLGASG